MNDALFNGTRRILLHVGCGPEGRESLPPLDFATQWREIRVDIDPSVQPDIIASIIDLAGVPDESVSMIFSKHNLEHVEGYQVPLVLGAFFRVLRPDGFAVIRTPDLTAVAKLILSKGLEVTGLYRTSRGDDITPLDILYGSRNHLAQGMGFMAHRTGFTAQTLQRHLTQAGFEAVQLDIRPLCELGAIALKVRAGNVYSNLTASLAKKSNSQEVASYA